MSELYINVIIATSIILTGLFAFYNLRRRRALERELSHLKTERPPDERVEIENKKKQLLDELDKELRQKREENDAEILKRKQDTDKFLEDYKKSRIQIVAAEIQKTQDEFNKEAGESAAELGQRLIALFAHVQIEQKKLEEIRRTQDSATEAMLRKALENEQYHLNLSEDVLVEVKELQNVAYKYGRIRPIILKAIYDVYYAPEVKKLVSRVVGDKKVAGIYRITCMKTGRLYVGRSVDIRERWVTHFKRAAGIETETQNLLYPAMRESGLENFTFEIIEVVTDESRLPEREKYWQTFYKAKEHGFSVK